MPEAEIKVRPVSVLEGLVDRHAGGGFFAMVVDTKSRIHTIRSMSLWRGSLHVTITAAAVVTRADVPMRINLPEYDESFRDCGTLLEDADFSWLQK